MANFKESMSNTGRSIKRFTIKVILVSLVLAVGVLLFLYFATYSKGIRAGVVLKVSERGAVFKTFEGQLDIMSFGAIKKADNQLTQTFEFSVYRNDEELIKDLENAALNGERVNIRYEEKYAILPWRGETKYFVIEVERLAANQGKQPERRSFPE